MVVRDVLGKTNSNIDTTIHVVQFKRKPNSLNQIMNTIITPRLKEILTESLESIADQMIRPGNTPAFQSFLIEGLFGTGKSHLLSFFNSLFDDMIDPSVREHLWEKVKLNFGVEYLELKKKKFLVVPIALHGSLQADLIDIIFREIEKNILERFNKKVNLSSPSKYIDFYKNKCAPGIKNEIDKKISEEFEDMNLVKFNALDEEENTDFYRKAEIVRECMKKLRLKIDDSYKIGDDIEKFIQIVLKESFEQLSAEIINNEEIGYDGIILLIDEFSEYLKSQKESELDEQGRKRTIASIQIQYLAEYVRDKNFFIFVAAQEELYSLDPLYEKQTGSGGRLKKLNLEYFHFVEIFNQLILPEKKNNKNQIESIFPTLKIQYFNDSQYSIYDTLNPVTINKDIFYECYPFHPKTIHLLMDHVLELSTKIRAGLSYTSTYVAKTLDKEIEELITPDTLFDYFKKEIKIKDQKKYSFIKDLIKKVQSEEDKFSETEKEVIPKVLKYIYLQQSPVYAEDCIINLFLKECNEDELEVLFNKLVVFSKQQFQLSFLRKLLNHDNNKQTYYLQVRSTYDIEDMILILSQMIKESEIYEYFTDKFFNAKLATGYFSDISIKNKNWKRLEYHIKYEDFEDVFQELVDKVNNLPKWTSKGVEFYDLFTFFNLPFKDEFDKFKVGIITKIFQKYESASEKLENRFYFFLIEPFNDLLISDIKKCLAFDLLNGRFHSEDPNWHGTSEIHQKILIGNDELLLYIKNFYNQNIRENKDDLLADLGKRQHEYSVDRNSPIYIKIEKHYYENFSFINKSGVVTVANKDKFEIIEDTMEDIIERYYHNFPEFLANTDYPRHINEILGELSKDQKTFEIPERKLNQLKGTAIIKIGKVLGIFSEVGTTTSGNKVFKIGLPEDNLFFVELMRFIPTEEEIEENEAEIISLAKICEFLNEKFGFSLFISRIFLATLLNQDKIKITNRSKTIIYNNSHVKSVFEDNVREFYSLYAFQTKKLTQDEITWLFSFYNTLFEDLDEYRKEFSAEISNLEEIDDVKSSKLEKLKGLLKAYNIDEIDAIKKQFEEILKIFNQKQEIN